MAAKRKLKLTAGFVKFLKEMIPVLAGVLIALGLNNWQQGRNDKEFVTGVLASISEELEENREELTEKLEEHQSFIDTLDFYMEEDTIYLSHILQKVSGVRFVQIKNTAWKSFLNPNINLVDYRIISVLTNIEEGKGHMKTQVDNIIALIYDSLEESDYSTKFKLQLMLGDLLYTESQMLEDHQEFLKIIPKK